MGSIDDGSLSVSDNGDFFMKLAYQCLCVMAVCSLLGGRASADFTMTFEGLQNFEGVANYYNSGLGSLGSGPGPNYGVTFDTNSAAYIPGQQSGNITPFPGDPSSPTVLLLFNPASQFGGGMLSVHDHGRSPGGFTQGLTFY